MRTRLADLDTVLGQTQKHKLTLLKSAATTLRRNYIKIRKMKSVYFILNQFSLREGQRVLIGRIIITSVNYKTFILCIIHNQGRVGCPPTTSRA